MKKITIAHIIYGLKYGGAEKLLTPLSTKINLERFKVLVVALTCGGPVEEELKNSGVDVRVMRRDGKFGLLNLFRLIWLIKKEKVDIVHTHLQNADLWGGIAAKLCRLRHVSTFHGVYFKKSRWEVLKQKLRIILPDKIIAVSRSTATHCIDRLKAKRDKVTVIYNGVDVGRFQVTVDKAVKRREIGVKDSTVLLGAFGRLEIEKGHVYLLEALSYLKESYQDFALVVIGEGKASEVLKKQASVLGLEREVKFLGNRSDIPELLKVMDIAIFSSLYEGLSLAILEAMASKRPIIATKVGGNPELIEEGKCGLLVSPRESRALADAILRLIKDGSLASHIALCARDKVRDSFTQENMISQIERLYEEYITAR